MSINTDLVERYIQLLTEKKRLSRMVSDLTDDMKEKEKRIVSQIKESGAEGVRVCGKWVSLRQDHSFDIVEEAGVELIKQALAEAGRLDCLMLSYSRISRLLQESNGEEAIPSLIANCLTATSRTRLSVRKQDD